MEPASPHVGTGPSRGSTYWPSTSRLSLPSQRSSTTLYLELFARDVTNTSRVAGKEIEGLARVALNTVVTSGRHAVASGHRVPGRFGPLDAAAVAHGGPPTRLRLLADLRDFDRSQRTRHAARRASTPSSRRLGVACDDFGLSPSWRTPSWQFAGKRRSRHLPVS